jgi:ABC-type enterochelin transport system ATPase subunit
MCVKNGRVLHLDMPDPIFRKDVISDLYDLPAGYYEQLLDGL